MTAFSNASAKDGFRARLWRGERMCLIGMDVDAPEADLVGFSIEVRRPGANDFTPLRNRLNFAYDKPADQAVDGFRNFPSIQAPFQKFRWIHFPYEPQPGTYTYRITKRHMPAADRVVGGTSIQLDIPLDPVTYDGFLDVGFTRNFASSQAYAEKYHNDPDIIPGQSADGLKFKKVPGDVYQWLGFEAYDLIFNFLDEAVKDPSIELDVFAYDLNEPDILSRFEQLGDRLRIIIDDSKEHAGATSAESAAARRLKRSAGAARVRRMHFRNLQHNKVFIAKRNGQPFKVLFGSTNFSFRGVYIQANNVLVVYAGEAATLFEQAFELGFTDAASFARGTFAAQWHLVRADGNPSLHFCFSPHRSSDLSLNPVGAAIDQASSSVLFSIAFLNQIKSGPTREAIDRLMAKRVFSYGVANSATGLTIHKPGGSVGVVDFAYLARNAPEPFKSEWSGGKGINIHHKFVITDFSLPTAKVFSGSSNLSPNGEKGNGDNLIMIEDPRVATGYAIEALRLFDHLHFRSVMKEAHGSRRRSGAAPTVLALRKPTALSRQPAWFAEYYGGDEQLEHDRLLFSH
jgi:phosphatidylserine/phosphatidylglycerophosphate/cardiolipin synthase-like enzyme